MLDKMEILGIKINKVTIGKAISYIKNHLDSKQRKKIVVTPNSEMIVLALKDPEIKKILNEADLSIPDGAGVVLASRILQDPLSERVAGFDLLKDLLSLANRYDYSVYLLGGEPGIVDLARENIQKEYSNLRICGCHHGYLDQNIQEQVINEISSLNPDLLFIGMGVPLQERFLGNNRRRLKFGIAMTVGGSFDILAGNIKRAPLWMQKLNLEWLFRLIQEPKRFFRMLALPYFVILVFQELFSRKVRGS